jgi:hypothetical protein
MCINSRHFGLNIVYIPTYRSHLDLYTLYVDALGGRTSSHCLTDGLNRQKASTHQSVKRFRIVTYTGFV